MSDQIKRVGPTVELSLRVSVATLSRVIFPQPGNEAYPQGRVTMLALENKATVIPGEGKLQVDVVAQPFGGAVRILNPENFFSHSGGFRFDSRRSRSEGDFRVYIRPSKWEAVREFCLNNLVLDDSPDLEADPSRELVEEFDDTLGIQLKPDQYSIAPVDIVIEYESAPTTNLHATGFPTVRIYRIDEVQIHDPILWQMMMDNSKAHPSRVLRRQALEDAQRGGLGRANGMLVAPVGEIRDAYLKIEPERRGKRLAFKNTLLAGNVAAVLEGIYVTKYRRFG